MTRLPGQPSLRVRGRSSGRTRTLPVRPVAVGDARYLVALLGDTNWARNLRASPTAVLVERRVEREIQAVEVFGRGARGSRRRSTSATSTYGPTIRLLDAAPPCASARDHPVFRIDDV